VKKYIVLIITTCFFLASFGQSSVSFAPIKYLLNKDVDQKVKAFAFVDSGVLKMSMVTKVIEEGRIFFNQKLDCFTKSFLINDTIIITGGMRGWLGWGFQLTIFKDSCIVNAFALSDGEIYKYATTDKSKISYIPLPCLTQKVLLAKTPSFKKGERITGYVDLVSNDFYYSIRKNDSKARIILRAYFKTAPLGANQ
jgi:hypothetical protein